MTMQPSNPHDPFAPYETTQTIGVDEMKWLMQAAKGGDRRARATLDAHRARLAEQQQARRDSDRKAREKRGESLEQVMQRLRDERAS